MFSGWRADDDIMLRSELAEVVRWRSEKLSAGRCWGAAGARSCHRKTDMAEAVILARPHLLLVGAGSRRRLPASSLAEWAGSIGVSREWTRPTPPMRTATCVDYWRI